EVDYTTNGLNNPARLDFAPGEVSKTFRIGLLDDTSEGEGVETVLLSSVDPSFDPLVGPDQPVYTMALQPDGKLLIGGDFATVNHITRRRMARLQADGALDSTFNVGAGPNRPVRAMVLQPDEKAIIGGFFTVIHGTNRNHIARLNR